MFQSPLRSLHYTWCKELPSGEVGWVDLPEDRCKRRIWGGERFGLPPSLPPEVLMGLLFEVTELDFELDVDSSSFLDETWVIPVSTWHCW